MKSLMCFLAAGMLLVSPAVLEAKISRTVEKSFAVQPGGKLKASTQGGDIVIHTADINEVRIRVRQTIRASSEEEADQVLADLTLTLEQRGNEVNAEAKYEKRSVKSWFGVRRPVTVSFTITVPQSFNLDLRTSGGDISAESLRGNVKAHTSGGDMRLQRIDGEVDGSTSGGDIFLLEGTARAKLHTSGGDVVVERAGGPIDVSTSGGDITLNSVEELIRAHTSGGDVNAVLTGTLSKDAVLSTSGGDVRVRVPKSAAFNLDASTSGGDVDAKGLTITIDGGGIGKRSLVGSVNGGGSRLKLRTSGGDIRIRTE